MMSQIQMQNQDDKLNIATKTIQADLNKMAEIIESFDNFLTNYKENRIKL